MKNRKYYKRNFKNYPDLVTIIELQKMLGNIAEGTIRKLLKSNYIKHYRINSQYLIPKVWVIDYILGEHYQTYKTKLKNQV